MPAACHPHFREGRLHVGPSWRAGLARQGNTLVTSWIPLRALNSCASPKLGAHLKSITSNEVA